MSSSVCRTSVWAKVVAVLAAAGAASVTRAAVAPPGTDSFAASPLVVARADLSPATEIAFLRLYYPADQLVEAPTRHPKPLSQIAENVTVITAQEIEDMNAHTVAEVLARVPGLYPQFLGVRFGAFLLPHIQGSGETRFLDFGSDERHVTVLVDGIPWNSLVTGGSSLETIPLGIVERIEVLRGPASSTWGGALAGVVNVITRDGGQSQHPSGSVAGSLGERATWDLRAGVGGAAGPLGYYLYGQRQSADWREPQGGFESRAAFAKTRARLGSRATLSLAGGYSRPELDHGHQVEEYAYGKDEFTARFGRAALDADLPAGVSLHLAGYRYDQRQWQQALEDGLYPGYVPPDYDPPLVVEAGELYKSRSYDEESHGAQAQLTWSVKGNTLVLGADYHRGEQDQIATWGRSSGAPPDYTPPPAEPFDGALNRWGIYGNDTLALGPVTLTPGLRWDDTSQTEPFISPSLGVTWQLGRETLLRTQVARGFTAPPVAWLVGGGLGIDPNPDLKPEQVWSYQGGVETSALGFVWLKATLFRHEVKDSMVREDGRMVNGDHIWRTGYELEGESAPLGGLVLRGSFSYVKVEIGGEAPRQDLYAGTAGAYWNRGSWHAQLAGHYVWWDLGGVEEGRHNDPLWDLNLRKTFSLTRTLDADLFFTAHNLFNGDLAVDMVDGTDPRWVEVGARVRF